MINAEKSHPSRRNQSRGLDNTGRKFAAVHVATSEDFSGKYRLKSGRNVENLIALLDSDSWREVVVGAVGVGVGLHFDLSCSLYGIQNKRQ